MSQPQKQSAEYAKLSRASLWVGIIGLTAGALAGATTMLTGSDVQFESIMLMLTGVAALLLANYNAIGATTGAVLDE